MGERFRFDGFVLDTATSTLTRADGTPVRLQPLHWTLLTQLVRQPHILHTREVLQDTLWPDIHVTDHSLTQLVSGLRKAVGRSGFIQTVPKRGYRLKVVVEQVLSGGIEAHWPAFPDRFIGRIEELERLHPLVDQGTPLLTLTGPGGVGKTRLVHELLGRLASLGHRVHLVEAARCTNAQGLEQAVAQTLKIQIQGSDPSAEIAFALSGWGPAIIVLDNLEQLVDATPSTLGVWMRKAPAIQWITTSRVVLGLRGERAFEVGLLPLASAEDLFLERSGLTRTPDIQRLVAQVEGHPLAIELAAARTRILTPKAISEGMDDALDLLRARHPDRPDRHQSIEAMLEGSWSLCAESEQEALTSLALFRGPFSLEAATAVLGRSPLDALQRLTDHSLLRSHPDAGRFSMLEVLRQFVRSRGNAAVYRAAATRLHAWFVEMAEEERHRQRALHPRGADALLVASLVGDMIAAVERCLDWNDAHAAEGIVSMVWQVLRDMGPVFLGVQWLVAVVQAMECPSVGILHDTAQALHYSGDYEGALYYIGVFQERLEPGSRLHASGIMERSRILQHSGRIEEALADAKEALSIFVTIEDDYHTAVAHLALAEIYRLQGRSSEALHHLPLGIDALRVAMPDGGATLYVLTNQVWMHHLNGQPDEALSTAGMALALAEEKQDHLLQTGVLHSIATVKADIGDAAAAVAFQIQAVAHARTYGSRSEEARQLEQLAEYMERSGDVESAELHAKRAQALYRAIGDVRGTSKRP
ncbi:MAG: tetratricopeptide repeat protein [Myxococcota bacterium]